MSWRDAMASGGWLALLLGGGDPGADPRASFVLLDLAGDGLALTDRFYPVDFDVDDDGALERSQWTVADQQDGFLFVDRDGDRLPAPGEMLRRIGDCPVLQHPEFRRVGVWIDADHDGVAAGAEVQWVADWPEFELSLPVETGMRFDGALNLRTGWAPVRLRLPRARATGAWAFEVQLPYVELP